MKLSRPPTREHPETIIPLIDVVFFLLIFFMLIGRMDATAPFEVTPAVALTGSNMPGGGATLSISQNGAFALNGAALTHAAVTTNIAELLAQDTDLLIRINAHKAAQLRHVLPLVAQIEAMGAKDVVLVVTPATP